MKLQGQNANLKLWRLVLEGLTLILVKWTAVRDKSLVGTGTLNQRQST